MRRIALLLVFAPTGLLAQEPVRVPSEPIPVDAVGPGEATPAPVPELPILADVVDVGETPLWLPTLDGVRGISFLRYNRTDGLIPTWGLRLEATDPSTTPTIAAQGGVATTHRQVYWNVSIDQRLPFVWPTRLLVGHFKRPASFDTWRAPARENDITTFVAAADRLDWWRERGIDAGLDMESPSGRYGFRASFLAATQRSMSNRSPFSVFSGDDFRDNPGVEEGDLRSLTLRFRYDGRDVQSPLLSVPGWIVAAEWERAGGLFGGDVPFVRGLVDVRRYNRLGRDAWIDFRLLWLGALTDRGVPSQRRVRLGGPGSLRGFPTATFQGDEALQLSTETRLPLPVNQGIALVFLNWHLVGLFDAAWMDDDEGAHANVGVGVSGINLFSYLGFFVAQRITDHELPDDGPRFIVRLRRDF